MFKKYFTYFFGLIFTLLFILIFPINVFAQDASLYFSPSTGAYKEGDTFWVSVMVDTKTEAVNAVAANFSYPQDKLEYLGVNTAGSALEIWVEKKAENGEVRLTGGTPSPGFSGAKKIASVGFKVKASSGNGSFSFKNDSAVVTNSDNKDILSFSLSGSGYYVFEPKITTPTTPTTPTAPTTPTTPTIPTTPTTPTTPTPLPLVISDISLSREGRTGIIISWKTDREADSVVEYGLTANYGFSANSEDLVKEHAIRIPKEIFTESLVEAPYHFKITSMDIEGESAETGDYTFIIPAASTPIVPVETSTPGDVQPTTTGPATSRPSWPAYLSFFIVAGGLIIVVAIVIRKIISKKKNPISPLGSKTNIVH